MSVYGTVVSRLILEVFLGSPICHIPMHHAKRDAEVQSTNSELWEDSSSFIIHPSYFSILHHTQCDASVLSAPSSRY